MEYAFLAIAIVSEVIATSYLKQTEGFTKLTPSLICAAAYIVCHYTFAYCLNRINLNIGYATCACAPFYGECCIARKAGRTGRRRQRQSDF